MPNQYDLTGRVALVTGAGSVKTDPVHGRLEGIGSAVAHALARSGCNLALTFNRSKDGAEALRSELLARHPHARIALFHYDAAQYMQTSTALVQQVLADFGAIDILVNNLGTTFIQPDEIPHHEPPAAAEDLMRVNFLGPYELTKRVLESMLAQNRPGVAFLVSSCSVEMPHAKRPAYAATKRALSGLAREFATFYGPHGIRLIDLQLGVFETPMTAPRLKVYREAAAKGAIPLARLGHPAELGELVAFLSTDACGYLTGISIPVDGGITIKSFDHLTLE
ncbi:MAG: SDR family NAD(P)-dependent oxidoreductase [Rhodanobacteraceae bacterium]